MKSDIEIIPISKLKGIDKVAEVNPLMSKLELEALILDIKANGQIEPITVCRDLIIDGRNRVKALESLGISEVKIHRLVRSTTINDKRKLVMSKETRRHKTPTQKACTAVGVWNTHKPEGKTQKEFISTYGISKANFANAQWLYKNNRQVFKALRDGKQVNIDRENKYKVSDSLNAVVKFYKGVVIGIDEKDIDKVYKDSVMINVESIINPMLDAMIISLNSLTIPPERGAEVKEEIAKTFYAKFKNSI